MKDYWRLRRGAPGDGAIIGALEALPEAHAREYVFGCGVSAFRMIVVRRSGAIHAYLNLCPHMSLPLNQEPGAFLSRDGQTLLCSRHFAQFDDRAVSEGIPSGEIDDRAVSEGIPSGDGGSCIAGACVGSRLERIPVHIDADHNMRIG
jgi:nitrite reductase/ring-hydroxylating ferredoxin subunit